MRVCHGGRVLGATHGNDAKERLVRREHGRTTGECITLHEGL